MSDNTKLSKDGLNQVWLKAMTILKSLTGNVRTDKGTLQEQIDKLEENASSGVDLTQAEYDALPDSKETDGVDYYITDEDFVATDAKAVSYDNSASGLAAKTAQVAIDEVAANIGKTNANIENYTLKTQITNPNLLDNPWFTVNQRGETKYGDETLANNESLYSVDRWVIRLGSAEITDDGIVVRPNQATTITSRGMLIQSIPDFKRLLGKTVTLSVKLSNVALNTNSQVSFGLFFSPSSHGATSRIEGSVGFTKSSGTHHITVTLPNEIPNDSYTHLNFVLRLYDLELGEVTDTCTIECVKLEIGSISTLALDTAPNYPQELAKCQRYYQRYNGSKMALFGYAFNTDGVRIYFPGIDMRDTPKVSFNNLILYRHGNSALATTVGIKSVGGIINHSGIKSVVITPETNIFEMGDVVMLSNKTDAVNPYIDFSADL